MADRGQMQTRLQQYRRDRRKFSIRVYLIAIVFAIITIAQWGALLSIDEIKDIFVEHYNYYISIITLLAALVLVTLFVFFQGLRFAMPLNWLVSILIVELVTVGLARIVFLTTMENCMYSLAVVSAVTILFILLGIFIRRDFTLDVVVVCVCAIVFFVGSVFFAAVAIVADISYSIMFYCGFVIATVLLFLMYHAQTINGGRYAEMRLNDYLLAALIIYHDFIIIYMLSLFISTAIAGENKLFNIYHGGSCSWCNSTSTSDASRGEDSKGSGGAAGNLQSLLSSSSTKPSPPPTKPSPPPTKPTPPPTKPTPPPTKPTTTSTKPTTTSTQPTTTTTTTTEPTTTSTAPTTTSTEPTTTSTEPTTTSTEPTTTSTEPTTTSTEPTTTSTEPTTTSTEPTTTSTEPTTTSTEPTTTSTEPTTTSTEPTTTSTEPTTTSTEPTTTSTEPTTTSTEPTTTSTEPTTTSTEPTTTSTEPTTTSTEPTTTSTEPTTTSTEPTTTSTEPTTTSTEPTTTSTEPTTTSTEPTTTSTEPTTTSTEPTTTSTEPTTTSTEPTTTTTEPTTTTTAPSTPSTRKTRAPPTRRPGTDARLTKPSKDRGFRSSILVPDTYHQSYEEYLRKYDLAKKGRVLET